MSQQRDFLPVRRDYPAPDPLPANNDARREVIERTPGATDAQIRACLRRPDPLPAPAGMSDADLPDTGPVSPTLRAAAWRAGTRAVEAAGFVLPTESEDAAIRREIAADVRGDLERDLAALRQKYPPTAPRATYSPPAGVPDAYSAGVYLPSQKMIDGGGCCPRPDGGGRVRVEADSRGWNPERREAAREAASSAGIIALAVACAVLLAAFACTVWGIASLWPTLTAGWPR